MKKWALLGVMAVFVAVPVVLWAGTLWQGMPALAYLYATGRLLALVGFISVFFQFVLSAKIKWIERNIGLDKLFGIHKTSGLIGLTFILIHPIPLTLTDLLAGRIPSITLPKLVGASSLLIFVIGASSAVLYSKLRLKYETWKAIHTANYVALPLGFVHSLVLGSDLSRGSLRTFWFILAFLYLAVLAHKLWRRIQIRRHPFQVAAVIQETHDTWTLEFAGKPVAYKPGQFLIVQLIRDGRVSEPHPFTLSSSPTRKGLAISVKSVGDFTSTIRHTKTADRAYIDAPYGAFSFLCRDAPDLLFIAGGIGITPFMSMLRYMADSKLERRVVLVWGNKSERDIAFRAELEAIEAGMPSLRVLHVMSSQPDWPGERGYVDAEKLSRALDGLQDPQVFLCGPPVMMEVVLRTLRGLGIPKKRIHYERFSLR